MSKHKWMYEVTDLEALEKAFPKAVITETRKVIARQVITKLLDCGVDVPGIKLTSQPTLDKVQATKEPTTESVPAFLKGHKHAEA